MNLSEQIMADMKEAMKNKDKIRLNTVRMIKSALMNEKIKLGHDLTKDDELTVLNREKKQREESIADFVKELAIVESYLPKQLSKEELEQIVVETIKEVDAKTKADFGKVMKGLMPKIKGRADGKVTSTIVREHLK